jgi:hypothetical protein
MPILKVRWTAHTLDNILIDVYLDHAQVPPKVPGFLKGISMRLPGIPATAMLAHRDQESFADPLLMRRQSLLPGSAQEEKLKHVRRLLLTIL